VGRAVRVLEVGPDPLWPGVRARRSADGPLEPYIQGRGVGGSTAINGGLLEVPDAADAERLGWPSLTQTALSLLPWLSTGSGAWDQFDRVIAIAGEAVLPGARAEVTTLARRDGLRLDAATAFLADRREVTVQTGALVDRVVFDDGRARGVQLADGEVVEARNVVLAAGALASPAILLRSGLGRVGTGLVDHPAVALSLVMGANPATEALPTNVVVRGGDVALVPLATGAVFGILLATNGRGTVRLASPDPAVPPEVTFDVLRDERDRARLRGIVRSLAALARHPAVASVAESATFGADGTPLEIAGADDATLDAWLVDHLAEVFHAAGSCHAVVDRTGLLKGTDNCWVVDASVLPDLPRCAPALTVSALAHLLATAMPTV